MQDKICMVTGASSGIGRFVAKGLADLGATVVMVCRDQGRGQRALDEIRVKSGNESIELMLADLSSQRSIHQFAREFKENHQRLDVLVNNAGGIFGSRRLTEDGIEMTFGLNHLGYFLLTHLLLDLLRASEPARIVNISSEAHRSGFMNFDDLQGDKRYRGGRAYSQSKLANILFTYELDRRLEGTEVTANCVHPGLVRTNFGNTASPFIRLALLLLKPVMLSPTKGADTTIYLASSPEVEGVTGKYFVNRTERASNPESYDVEVARRLWEVSTQLTDISNDISPAG